MRSYRLGKPYAVVQQPLALFVIDVYVRHVRLRLQDVKVRVYLEVKVFRDVGVESKRLVSSQDNQY